MVLKNMLISLFLKIRFDAKRNVKTLNTENKSILEQCIFEFYSS